MAFNLDKVRAELNRYSGPIYATEDALAIRTEMLQSACDEIDRLRGALKDVEWGCAHDVGATCVVFLCPDCENEKADGHTTNCVVGDALKGEG